MNRFRTRWLALVGAMLLLGLSVSSAFGAHPQQAENRGNAVSSFVHDLVFGSDEDPDQEDEGDEDQDEEEDQDDEQSEEEDQEEDQDEDQDDEQSEEEDSSDNHGQCVREVAWVLDEVGGLNENHGGAVSEAARVTCRSDGDEEEPSEGAEEEEDGEESLESTDDSTDDSTARGNSAWAHEHAPGKNKATESGATTSHPGRGHGRGGH